MPCRSLKAATLCQSHLGRPVYPEEQTERGHSASLSAWQAVDGPPPPTAGSLLLARKASTVLLFLKLGLG